MNATRRWLASLLVSAGPWVGSAQAAAEQGAAQNANALSPTSGLLTSESSRPRDDASLAKNLRLDFHNTPLDSILDYLSGAAGFIIHKAADPKGTLDVSSKELLSKAEAVNLINSVLQKKGYGVTCSGRILTVTSLDSLKTSDLEVATGNDPDAINKSGEVITQVIPVRYANATQLLNNLQLLLPATASLSANESANSLVLVAAKTDVRRILRIVKALDTSIATVSSIKVIPVRYADAKQLASVIQQFFSPQSTSSAINTFPGFGPPGFGGLPGADQNSSDPSQTSKAAKVSAAADEASNCLIVSAPAGVLGTIIEIVARVDRPVTAATEVRIFKLENADPAEIADQLSKLFPDNSQSNSSQDQQGPIFGGLPGPGGGPGGFPAGPPGFAADNGNASTGTRTKAKGQVIAVADPRTSSVMVSASSPIMPQIARMIAELDRSAARREIVKVFELQNADPQDVNQVLQDLFNRNSSMRNNNNNNRSLLGQGNPLTTRETEQQTTSSQTSGFGNAGGPGGGGAGGGGNAPGGL